MSYKLMQLPLTNILIKWQLYNTTIYHFICPNVKVLIVNHQWLCIAANAIRYKYDIDSSYSETQPWYDKLQILFD